jgi:uracil-DNA glycosylase
MSQLGDVYEDYRSDPAFDHLRTDGIVLVPGEGSSRPNVLIVGKAPGALENTLRRPFMGPDGRALRSLITDAAGLSPEQYFITNLLKYRPRGNRTPYDDEVKKSVPYLRREWSALGRPEIIVTVDDCTATALVPDLLGGVLINAGRAYSRRGGVETWVMLDPALGIRNHAARPTMEEHWTALGAHIREVSR